MILAGFAGAVVTDDDHWVATLTLTPVQREDLIAVYGLGARQISSLHQDRTDKARVSALIREYLRKALAGETERTDEELDHKMDRHERMEGWERLLAVRIAERTLEVELRENAAERGVMRPPTAQVSDTFAVLLSAPAEVFQRDLEVWAWYEQAVGKATLFETLCCPLIPEMERPQDPWSQYLLTRVELALNDCQNALIARFPDCVSMFGKEEIHANAGRLRHSLESVRSPDNPGGSDPDSLAVWVVAMEEIQNGLAVFDARWPLGGRWFSDEARLERKVYDVLTDPSGQRLDGPELLSDSLGEPSP